MPVSAKKAANDRRARPNSLSRRERTRNENKCQLCETKTPLKSQFVVTNDLEAGKVKVSKDCTKKGRETASHYCEECKDKRVKQKSDWLATRDGSPKPKGKKKGKAKAKKGAKKAVKKAPKKAAKKAPKKAKKKEAF